MRTHHLDVPLAGVLAGGGRGLHRHLLRVAQVLLGDPADGAGHRGREEGHLLLLGGGLEDLVDLFGEAHAQHLVGFVEDDVLQVRQVKGTLVDVVDHAPRGTDDDLGATAHGRELRAVGGSAVDGQDGEVTHVLGVGGEGLGDL